jgi:hypothetical protein
MPVHMRNIRKIKTLQDSVSCLPIDVIKHITESFVKSLDSSDVLDTRAARARRLQVSWVPGRHGNIIGRPLGNLRGDVPGQSE